MTLPPELDRARIFDGLSPEERRGWLEVARSREFARGAVVARQGEPATDFCLVESGFLKVVQGTADGHELIVRFVGANEPFGGVVALDGATYPVTAMAVEPSRMLSWNRAELGPLLERCPQVRANIMREMTDHMTDALTRVQELSTARVGQRLAQALLRLMRQCGRRKDDGSVVLLHSLTRQELADLTGTTLFTVSRTLSQWTSDGVLGSEGRRVVIRDRARLQRLAT